MAAYRHLSRIVVTQALFAYEFHGGSPDIILQHTMSEFGEKITDTRFAFELLHGVLEHKEDIRSIVEEHAPEWPFPKIAPLDRAILEIGVYEIVYSKDVPPVVAINEGIEIAKVFGSENSPKFINGVLSAVMHKFRPNEVSAKEK